MRIDRPVYKSLIQSGWYRDLSPQRLPGGAVVHRRVEVMFPWCGGISWWRETTDDDSWSTDTGYRVNTCWHDMGGENAGKIPQRGLYTRTL